MREFILLLLLGVAAVSDFRCYRVSNAVFLAGLILLAGEKLMRKPDTLLFSFLVLLGVLMAGLFVYAMGMAGAADVKLLALILFSYPDSRGLRILLWILFIAGLCSVLRLARGKLFLCRLRYFRNYCRFAAGWLKNRANRKTRRYYSTERDGYEAVIPFAVCCFAGVLCEYAAAWI